MKAIILAIAMTLSLSVQANEYDDLLGTPYDCVMESQAESFDETLQVVYDCNVTLELYIEWTTQQEGDDYEWEY